MKYLEQIVNEAFLHVSQSKILFKTYSIINMQEMQIFYSLS